MCTRGKVLPVYMWTENETGIMKKYIKTPSFHAVITNFITTDVINGLLTGHRSDIQAVFRTGTW